MCVADEPFLGEIVQPDLAGAGETMRPIRGNTHSEAIKFFKGRTAQRLVRRMFEQGDLQFAFAQPVQHFLGGKVVQDNAHAVIRFLKELQRTPVSCQFAQRHCGNTPALKDHNTATVGPGNTPPYLCLSRRSWIEQVEL